VGHPVDDGALPLLEDHLVLLFAGVLRLHHLTVVVPHVDHAAQLVDPQVIGHRSNDVLQLGGCLHVQVPEEIVVHQAIEDLHVAQIIVLVLGQSDISPLDQLGIIANVSWHHEVPLHIKAIELLQLL